MALETSPFERVVHTEDLGIPHWDDFTFKYTVVELAAALKASTLKFFFAAYGFPKLIYFDADIALYAPLDDLEGEFIF
ncbi:MAG TPA: hypothetical protein PLD47_15155 [Aggregatilineales bacterium]|nr:hypothetical protein [Anaerolineales bacterium]HRE49064.1 hypothetical protein [Aggregatilineales bacterium]